jgi:AraC family transcriptional regulator of adaptative response / DNA-3-methyladenine glycosylase II
MQQLFDLSTRREFDAHARAWQPWRAYAVLRLWNSLENSR